MLEVYKPEHTSNQLLGEHEHHFKEYEAARCMLMLYFPFLKKNKKEKKRKEVGKGEREGG